MQSEPPIIPVFHAGEVEEYARAGVDLAAGITVAFDAGASVELARRRAGGATVWDLIDGGEVRGAIERARAAWWDAARLGFHGADLLRLVGWRHDRWIARCVFVSLGIERAIERWGGELVVLGGAEAHALDRAEVSGPRPILRRLAAGVAKRAGRGVRVAGTIQENSEGEPPAKVKGAGLGSARTLVWCTAAEAPRLRGITSSLGENTLMVVRGGETSGIEVSELEAIGAVWSPVDGLVRARRAFEAKAGKSDDLAMLFAHDGLRAHLGFLFGDYAWAMAGNVERWVRAFKKSGVERVLSAYPCVAVEVAARMGIETIVLPHGEMMVGEDACARSLPVQARVGAVGAAHADRLRSIGIEPGRVVVTGAPGAEWSTPTDTGRPKAGRVLVLAQEAASPGDLGGAPRTRFDREMEVLRTLGEARAFHGWDMRVRCHPRYDRDESFYTWLMGTGIRFDRGGTLEQAALGSDVVVVPGGPSSAVIEASAAGRPVLLAGSVVFGEGFARWGLGGWPTAENAEELESMIHRAVDDEDVWSGYAAQTAEALAAFRGGERAEPEAWWSGQGLSPGVA